LDLFARTLSWLFILVGLTLGGLGVYEYYAGKVAQKQAEEQWKSPSAAGTNEPEEPVPARLPAKSMPYFDPYRPGQTVAKLLLPGLATPLFVVEGTDQQDLKLGPGHMPGTALPGVAGNCVIAGHRDTHFRALKGIHKGGQLEIETKYGKFLYTVRSMEVVSPTNVSSLYPTTDAQLHLITCYPFNYVGHAPQRMVIEASLQR
jgi:sortase A